jgi:hypothetical protein
MKNAFWIALLFILLLGCESVEDMQKKVEHTNASVNQTHSATLPPSAEEPPLPSNDDHEEALKPTVQDIKSLTPPVQNETPQTNITPEPSQPQAPTFVPTHDGNACANLPKILCNQKDECEYTLDENTGKQYCRQRCKLYPLGECSNAGGCVVKYDRRNNSVCITNCAAFSNADLCDRYADCGWSEGNCTSLGIR